MKAIIFTLFCLFFSTILQAQVTKTVNLTAGNLISDLTAAELSSVTNLTLTGTIDARDFKTMRDEMPLLAEIDLSNVAVVSYNGSNGTGGTYETSYPPNTIPFTAFFNQYTEKGKISLTSVLLPLSVTSIDIGAFYKCSGLTSVSIPSSVTSFGNYAFAECGKLNAITISSVVSTIGSGAFLGCGGLITVDANNPDFSSLEGVLYNKILTNLIHCPTSKTGSFVIPTSVNSIVEGAFYGCSSLESVSIPASVTSIGYIAFYGCSGLTSITTGSSYPVDLLPDNDVFSGVNKTACTLNVPFGAKQLYAKAIGWCEFITITEEKNGFNVGTSVLKIESSEGSIATVNLAANVAWTASSDQTWLAVEPTSGTSDQTITFTAEANESKQSRSAKITFSAIGFAPQILTVNQDGINVTINVKAGGLLSALSGTDLNGISDLKLTGVIDARDFRTMRDSMPNLSIMDLTDVKVAAYTGSDGTSGYYSTYSANAIPVYAFVNPDTDKGKISLTKVELPLSIITIDYNSFKGCTGITSVVINSSVTSIGYNAFANCSGLVSINIPSSVTMIDGGAFTNSGTMLSVDGGNMFYSSIDGVLFNKDRTTLIYCPTSKTGNYNIPTSVINIEYGAFQSCKSLSNITLPSSVISVKESAFNNCTALISVDTGNPNYSGIDGVLFNKNATALIKCPVSKSGSFVIPSTVTIIDVQAFYYCSLLSSVTIPVSVTSIASGAFDYCTGLTSIFANSSYPVKIDQYTSVFMHVNQITCTLYVPFGAKKFYAAAEQWKNFTNIVEQPNGFILSSAFLKLDAAEGSSDTINITANVAWTASSSQAWLTMNPTSGSGNNTFTFTAAKNNSLAARIALVTVSATGFDSHVVIISQDGSPKTINTEAGSLHSQITSKEISNLIITGTMDARDFKFLRDSMPSLTDLDLSGVTIVAYSGNEGTWWESDYPANSIPQYAFYNTSFYYLTKSNLTTVILPSSINAIGVYAFAYCMGLTTIAIPPSVTSIGHSAFYNCRGLTSIYARSGNPVDLTSGYSVFSGVNKTTCTLNVPYQSKKLYASAAEWKDFINIIEDKQGFRINPMFHKLNAGAGSNSTSDITANVTWTATSDQSWLTVNPTSGAGDKALMFTAEANETVITRVAKVTVSATDITSQDITITQDGNPKTINITAGGLLAGLTTDELNGITNLIITGTIDARDFKTMRDNMPSLAILNINGATVVAYSGTEVTSYQTEYPANTVPNNAFYNSDTGKGKTSLTSIVLPTTLKKIGTNAFQNCSGLNSVIIPSGVSEFESYAFSGCSNLTSVDLPISLRIIQFGVFKNCISLTTISIPSVVLIGNEAFSGCTGLTTVNLPSSLVYIWDYAFSGCSNLTAINLPGSVKTIGGGAFSGCSSLTSIVIPSSVTSIANGTFQLCTGLTSVTIPSSITSIGGAAFSFCRSLTSVTIPVTVTFIGSSAFAQCTGLASIFANSSHPVNLTSSPGVFSGIDKTSCTLNVPYKAKELYASADQWKDFIKINDASQGFLLDSSIVRFSVQGGSVLVNSTANVVWTAVSDQTWLTVNPTSGTGIQKITFNSEENKTVMRRTSKVTVSAPDVLSQIITVIQEGRPDTINIEPGGLLSGLTFAELNGISNLTITGTIDARDFKTMRDKMPSLEVLDLSGVTIAAYSGAEGTSYQTEYPANTVPENAFNSMNIGKGKTGLTAVVLPSSVIAVGNYAFKNCIGLTAMNIPSSVNSIGYGAFMNCVNLTSLIANSAYPVDLSNSWSVFEGINKTNCILNVPFGSKDKYDSAYQWQDFINIIEPDSGFRIEPTILNISADAGSNATATITSNVTWTASCDQLWLTVNPASGTGDKTLTFTAEVNSQNTSRKAIVTISAQGIPSQIVYVTQEPAPLEVTAGNLKTLLSAEDLATRTKLTLIGTIDARDFKTMRDDMPNLKEIDLQGVTIVSYSGNEGTTWYITEYPANKFPDLAFYSLDSYSGKQSLTSVSIPNSVIKIGSYAFQGCNNLTKITVPESVTSIEDGAFMLCNKLTSVNIPSSVTFIGSWVFNYCYNLVSIVADPQNPVNLSNSQNVFNGVNVYSCLLNVSYGSRELYASAYQWQDFINIIEPDSGIRINPTILNISATAGSTDTATITSNVPWTASSDQTWLTVNPSSGTGTQTLNFNAEANTQVISRIAIVTFSASGIQSKTIVVTQEAPPLTVTAGKLKTLFTAEQLSSITKLKLTGTIDARDFKTMRDDMPNLAEIDLSNVLVKEYTGKEGTFWDNNAVTTYPANEIPIFAFHNQNFCNSNLTSVILPVNTKSIGWDAFACVRNLTSISIPPTVTKIHFAAIAGCQFLNVKIPSSVTFIDVMAFSGSNYIEVDEKNPNYCDIDGVLFNKTKTTIMQCPVSKTGNYTIPSTVTRIDDHVFDNCERLTLIKIPSTVTSIGHFAFLACVNLTSITIPTSVTFIGDGAFSDCMGLTSIYSHTMVPVDLSNSKNVFLNVNKTTCTLYVPKGSKDLYKVANQWKDFLNIVEYSFLDVPEGYVNIEATEGSKANVLIDSDVNWTASSNESWLTVNPASGNNSQTITFTAKANQLRTYRKAQVTVSAEGLESKTIYVIQAASKAPLEVTAGNLKTILTTLELTTATSLTLNGTIDARDFKTMRDDIPNLAEIDLSGVTVVEYTGTEGTAGTENKTYPANAIPECAFGNIYTGKTKTILTSFIFPFKTTSIGYGAFWYCTGLSKIKIPSSITHIDAIAFSGVFISTSVTIPKTVISIGGGAFYLSNYIIVENDNPNYSSLDGVLFNKDKTIIMQIPPSKTGNYNIPNSVEVIGYAAFFQCSKLSSVNIPSSVTTIGYAALSDLSELKTLIIPSSVVTIETFAFSNCTGLTKLYSESSKPVNLTYSLDVFGNINKTACTLYVPFGSKALYEAADQWKDFTIIVEMPGLILSATTVQLTKEEGSTNTVKIISNSEWNVICDQLWLTVDSIAGTGNKTLTLTAKANPDYKERIATITVSGNGIESQTIIVTQNGIPVGLKDIPETSTYFKCYPNPFAEQITIEISNPKRIEITVDMYNIMGERIKNLVNRISDENIEIFWNGTNDKGQKVAPGVYICKMNNLSKQLIFEGYSGD